MKCNGQLLSHKKLKRAKRKESKSKSEWQKDVWHYMNLGPITTHFIHKMWPVFAGSRKNIWLFFSCILLRDTYYELILMYSSCVLKKFGYIHLVSYPNIHNFLSNREKSIPRFCHYWWVDFCNYNTTMSSISYVMQIF